MTKLGCDHEDTRMDPEPWPTGEDLEICTLCGCSRLHSERDETAWVFFWDLAGERASLVKTLEELDDD